MFNFELLIKTRDYLTYLERHLLNVEKAWKELQKQCKDMRFVYDDYVFNWIDQEVRIHDLSKFDEAEFVQYRRKFFAIEGEEYNPKAFDEAWDHHKEHNPHHWENWTKQEYYNPYEWEVHCVHMVIDWMAMSYYFNDTAKEYYEKNKKEIQLPDYAVKFIREIFSRLEAGRE